MSTGRLQVVVLLAAFLPVSLAAPLTAQEAQPGATVLTVNARLVVLDVVVTDKSGKPVAGLTANDFRILEDNQPQRIRNFEAPSAHALPEDVATSTTTIFDPASPKTFGQSPVTILVLDQLNTHFADSGFARRSLHDYLAKQPALLPRPTTLLTVFDSNFKPLQGFTRDRDLLLKSLDATQTHYAWQLELQGKTENGPVEREDQSLRALQQIAQSFARIPGRKNLVWVGGGFPTIDPTILDTRDATEVKNTLQHLTDVLLATRVTVYAVDPTSSAAGMTEIVDESQQFFADAAGDGLAGGSDPFDANDDFDRLGPVTGGRVVRGMNNVADQIANSIDLGANFYTLAYSPTSGSDQGAEYRKIRVECLKPGLKVVTRAGYYTERTTQEKSAETAAYDLTTAAQSSIPLNALKVDVVHDTELTAAPDSYIVRVSAPGLTWKPGVGGKSVASVYVMAVSFGGKHKMLGHTLHGMTATAKAGANLRDEAKTADFVFVAPPFPKATMMRFVVRDSATGNMGSVDIPLKP